MPGRCPSWMVQALCAYCEICRLGSTAQAGFAARKENRRHGNANSDIRVLARRFAAPHMFNCMFVSLVDARLLRLSANHQNLGGPSHGFLQLPPESDGDQAALNCNSYCVCSVFGTELVDQIFDMEIDGRFRDCQVICDFFVAVSVANEAENLQFSTRKILVAQVLRDTRGNFMWNVALSGVN